ncbi:hypothetical protein KSP39_PZI000455 [Platanthera zijinensis]|uniref:DUF7912 domain-containing protein n=1 Tax=Platanthera zijinensis TaxID=2320716 RepID=A0AAP0C2H2_9ASPA
MRKAALLAAAICRRLLYHSGSFSLPPSSFTFRSPHLIRAALASNSDFSKALPASRYSFSSFTSRHRSTSQDPSCGEIAAEDEDWGVEWEEEEETEPAMGDGGDGGGVVLGNVKWGEHALSLAREVLHSFGDDIALYAFKVSPKGYIYVRLDRLTNRYGCPDIEEIENFNKLYKKRLDEAGEAGAIPTDMALEVSSPGAERLLDFSRDLNRFREMAMWVRYLEENENPGQHKQPVERVLVFESMEGGAECCVFKLADVKENRAELGKGRPLTRKLKDWRLGLPFKSILRIKLYLDSRA